MVFDSTPKRQFYVNRNNEINLICFRINIFGFPSRQHFEEFFMSLLLLINKENDANIVGESLFSSKWIVFQ